MADYNSSYTGLQIDTAIGRALNPDSTPTADSSSLVTSGGVASAVSAVQNTVSRRNLLDNPWFTVNQRGAASYSSAGYTVDRWYNKNALVASVGSSGLTLNPNGQSNRQFGQKVENASSLGGKTVTLSVLVTANSLTGGMYEQIFGISSLLVPAGQTGMFQIQHTLQSTISDNEVLLRFNASAVESGTITISAVKLELGSVSTLANDTAPNYAEELVKCQRYYWDAGFTSTNIGTFSGASNIAGSSFDVTVPTPVPMRAVSPTITVGVQFIRGEGSDITGYTVNTGDTTIVNGFVVRIAFDKSSGYTARKIYTVAFNKLTISCDL